MYKLLLVDDEPIIVEGLYEVFSAWKGGCLDVYKAYSAQEALDWLSRKKIDVVISDIMMPEMDGLQLLEKVRRNWPECRVIFLTGYDEFDYIYEAVRHSGVSYLLKTESNESVVALAERHFEEITAGYRSEELMKKAEDMMNKALPLLQKEFLAEIFDGTEAEVSQRQLDELAIPLDAGEPVIPLIGCLIGPEVGKKTHTRTDLYSVNSTIEQYFAHSAVLAGTVYQREYVVWLLQPRAKDGSDMGSREAALYYRNMLESVQSACVESFHLKASFAIGSDAVQWRDISITTANLKSLLNGSIRQGMELIVTDSQFRERADDESHRKYAAMQLKKLDGLATYLELGKREDFFRVLSELKAFFTSLAPRRVEDDEAHYAISLLFISHISRHSMKEAVSARLQDDSLWRSKPYATITEAFPFFERIAEAIFELQTVETEKRSIASIQEVQAYIQDNPEKDLSLNSLADMVYFNPKYLSRLFKQATGVNLSDYINEKRLLKAKELLRKSHIKIYEVAQAVGYSSNSYFTMFFKKGTNMTPQEYRDASNK